MKTVRRAFAHTPAARIPAAHSRTVQRKETEKCGVGAR
jgi:hypothetical protein